jgi:hypothetical protein
VDIVDTQDTVVLVGTVVILGLMVHLQELELVGILEDLLELLLLVILYYQMTVQMY